MLLTFDLNLPRSYAVEHFPSGILSGHEAVARVKCVTPISHQSEETTLFWALTLIGSWLLDLLAILRLADSDKDLELLLLRRQIRILERHAGNSPRLSRWEKLSLAVLVHKLKERTGITRRQLGQSVFIFTPATILRWHRELVRRKWTFTQRRQSGRPRTDAEIETLIVRFARGNPR